MRLFLSIPVPAALADAATLSRLKKRFPEGRWTDPAQWHLTVKFLGETPVEKIEDVLAAATVVARRIAPFEIALGALGVFPENPTVLWAGVEIGADPLARLARDVESALEPWGFPIEKRSFQPHLTLARFKKPLRELPPDLPPPWGRGFEARVLELMESRPDRNGSTYRVIKGMVLGPRSEAHS